LTELQLIYKYNYKLGHIIAIYKGFDSTCMIARSPLSEKEQLHFGTWPLHIHL